MKSKRTYLFPKGERAKLNTVKKQSTSFSQGNDHSRKKAERLLIGSSRFLDHSLINNFR